jgi:uncharacterized membrane protein (UPF0127 family)
LPPRGGDRDHDIAGAIGYRHDRWVRGVRTQGGSMTRATFYCLALLFAPLSGCATDGAPWVELKGQRFKVEIASDEPARTRGLMFRDTLEEDRGMLFVFEREQPLAFWMKNTKIPLDIIYFDDERRLVSVASAPPCTTPQCPNYPSDAPARYTLELKAGTARRIGARRGDPITFSPGIGDPAKR